METKKNPVTNKRYVIGLLTGLLIATLAFNLVPTANQKIRSYLTKPTPTPDLAQQQSQLTNEVLPKEFDLGVSFGDSIVKLVESGAIDKDKFIKLYEGRSDLTAQERNLLDEVSNKSIVVTKENAGVILNLLWPLGIANKTNVLSEGPMGTQYKNEVGNFASTGGWTLGKQDGGKLFNKYSIVALTSEQEALVSEITQNIYRPCCGNSTYFPDCNHGAAMLGFVELAVAQGMPKDEVYRKALVLNSYWFPQTYVELATYFKEIKNTNWDQVDPELALGIEYSSGQGYQAINKELAAKGLIPQVSGGGSCGV